MGSFADYLEDEVLDHVFGAAAFTAPATIYFALSTTAISDDGTGMTEPAAGAYARKAMANNKTTWATSSGGSLANAATVTFVTATASWGTISHFAIMDAAASGNMLVHGALTSSKAVSSGDTAKFSAGDFTITLS